MISLNASRFLIFTAFVFLVVLSFDGTVTSSAPRVPTAPTNLTVGAVTETTIAMSWGPSKHNRSFSYQVRMTNLTNSQYNTIITVGSSQTSYTARFLPMNSNYSITVSAVDDRGNSSANSNTVTVRTLADETPPTTPVLETLVLGPSQVRLSWNESTDNIPLNCCSYIFFMNGVRLTQHINWAAAPTGFNAVVIRHLTPGSTNTFRVDAIDYTGNTAMSNPSTATTETSTDTVPPSIPTNVRLLRDNGCAEVWLGWTQSTDDVDPQFSIEYEIYVNGVLSPLPVSAGVSEDFVYGTGFPDNTFTVKAVDRTGNTSEASAPLFVQLWPC
jgi:Fibronectin type III domain.